MRKQAVFSTGGEGGGGGVSSYHKAEAPFTLWKMFSMAGINMFRVPRKCSTDSLFTRTKPCYRESSVKLPLSV